MTPESMNMLMFTTQFWHTDRQCHHQRLTELRYTFCAKKSDKKLSYRRETARQLHTSFSAHSLIVHFTEHRIYCCTTRLAKLVSTLSANKPCDIRTLSWIGHSRSFKVILIGADRNPKRCVVAMCNLCRRYFWNVRRLWQRENDKVVDFSDPTQVWWRPGKKRLRIGLSTVARNYSHWPIFLPLIVLSIFITFHARIFRIWTLWV